MLSRLSKGTLYQLLYGASQSEGVRRHALETDPNAILQKAEKAESSSGSKWYSLGSSKDKLEGAAGLYVQAANAFRMANQQEQAGKAFAKAAEVQTKAGEIMDAANTYQDAFKMYRKIDPQRAVGYLNITVNTYALGTKETGGNPRRAATQLQVVGEVYETEEFANLDKQTRIMKAIEAYEKAAGWFTAEGAPALANKLLLKMAELAASVGQVEGPPAFEGYIMASELFEQVSKESVSNNLMKWSVKDYLLKAGICRLAQNDLPAANGALRNYREWDTTFPSTMEHQLLVDLIEAVNSKDAEEFAGKLYEYDQKSKLDKWKTDILLKIKNKIEEDVDDFS